MTRSSRGAVKWNLISAPQLASRLNLAMDGIEHMRRATTPIAQPTKQQIRRIVALLSIDPPTTQSTDPKKHPTYTRCDQELADQIVHTSDAVREKA